VRLRLRRGGRVNLRLLVPVVGGALLGVGLGMLACVPAALLDGGRALGSVAVPAAVLLPLGTAAVLSAHRLPSETVRARDGFLAVTLAWIAAAAVGAVPFLLAGTYDRAADAFFESMSAITTTGATRLPEVEAEADAILLWRSMAQWLGGVGIVVLVVAIAPAAGLAIQRVFYAETSGITAERLTPRIAETAKIIVSIYLVLSLVGVAAFWVAGMGPFDAVNHSFAAIATGGFSTRTASIAAFDSLAIELVAIVVMAAGGVNFAFYWLLLRDRSRLWPQAGEVRAYLAILAAATAAVTLTLVTSEESLGFWGSLRASAFAVVSLMTTTGFTTDDFDLWHDFARLLLLVLMFVGACAGSTAGGIKVVRVQMLARSAGQEVQRQLRPKAVQVLRVHGRVYSEDLRRSVLGFFSIYVLVFLVGTLSMAALGLDPVTAASSVAATLNVIGPGLGEVGGAENFGVVPEGGLWLLSLLMLIGRLEVFTVLVLLTPAFWRRDVA
jgi:trk system potassium uptake protein